MSRSGYSDYMDDQWAYIRWRGVVASATRGRRGQKLLRDLRDALDAMPVKRLITGELKCDDGVCALGALGERRGIDMRGLDPYDPDAVAGIFDVASPLAKEIVFMNDEGFWGDPEGRWKYMRRWVDSQIREETNA